MVDLTGTITDTVYDALDRVSSIWVGTNDTPLSGTWSPTNNTGTANMGRDYRLRPTITAESATAT